MGFTQGFNLNSSVKTLIFFVIFLHDSVSFCMDFLLRTGHYSIFGVYETVKNKEKQ
jgi:hypothetical protein